MNSLISFLGYGLSAADVAELRSQAREQLTKVKVSSSDPALALDGALAEVVDETESVDYDEGAVGHYYLTQVVRNDAGEHFLLKTTDKSPFVNHLPQARAKTILKGKYRAPHTPENRGEA